MKPNFGSFDNKNDAMHGLAKYIKAICFLIFWRVFSIQYVILFILPQNLPSAAAPGEVQRQDKQYNILDRKYSSKNEGADCFYIFCKPMHHIIFVVKTTEIWSNFTFNFILEGRKPRRPERDWRSTSMAHMVAWSPTQNLLSDMSRVQDQAFLIYCKTFRICRKINLLTR